MHLLFVRGIFFVCLLGQKIVMFGGGKQRGIYGYRRNTRSGCKEIQYSDDEYDSYIPPELESSYYTENLPNDSNDIEETTDLNDYNPDDNPALTEIINDLQNFNFISQARPGRRGGGVCIFFRDNLTVTRNNVQNFESFEVLDVNVKTMSDVIRLITIYRPPSANVAPGTFLSEFSSFLETVLNTHSNLTLVGDFNVHMDNSASTFTKNFTDTLDTSGLHQHVSGQTHISGHTLDLVITRTDEMSSVKDLTITEKGFSQ